MLVRSLDELGIREKTVLIFTGDNGTGGAGKSTATELGARVPLIVNGPGIVKTRGSTGELADMTDILPTVLEFAGIEVPTDRPIDGRSLAPFLRGETDEGPREWAYAFQADRRIYRTKRYLLEDNSPLHYGRLFDYGESRNGMGYVNITESTSAEAKAARAYFDRLIAKHSVPYVAFEGPPNGAATAEQRAAKEAKNRAKKEKRVNKGKRS